MNMLTAQDVRNSFQEEKKRNRKSTLRIRRKVCIIWKELFTKLDHFGEKLK